MATLEIHIAESVWQRSGSVRREKELKETGRGIKKKKSFLRRPWLDFLWNNNTPQERAFRPHTHEGAAERSKGKKHKYSLSLSPSESSEMEEPKSPKVTCIGQVRVGRKPINTDRTNKKTKKTIHKKKKRVKKKRRGSSCYFLSCFHASRHPTPEAARSIPESGANTSIFARFLLLLAQLGRSHNNLSPQEAPLQILETKPNFLQGLTEETRTRLYWESSLNCRTIGEGFNEKNSSSDLVSILRRSYSAPAGGRRIGLFCACKDVKRNAFMRRCKSYSFALSLEEEEKEQRGQMELQLD